MSRGFNCSSCHSCDSFTSRQTEMRRRAEAAVEKLHRVEVIKSYSFDLVKEQLRKSDRVPERLIDVAVEEFRKYLILIAQGNGNVAMISKRVDEVWHAFILLTRDYVRFSNEVFGEYLHHQPVTEAEPAKPEDRERFIELYKKEFGELHEIWGAGVRKPAGCSTDCESDCNCA